MTLIEAIKKAISNPSYGIKVYKFIANQNNKLLQLKMSFIKLKMRSNYSGISFNQYLKRKKFKLKTLIITPKY